MANKKPKTLNQVLGLAKRKPKTVTGLGLGLGLLGVVAGIATGKPELVRLALAFLGVGI